MTFQKTGLILLSVVVAVVISGIALVNSWKETPYGTLHTNAAILVKFIELRGIDIFAENNTPAQIRATSANSRGLVQKKPVSINQIVDTTFPGPAGPVPIRIYTPRQDPSLPVIIYYHGGGWVIGGLDSHDNICRSLAHKTKGIVVSVGYRLAPEHPFPAAVDDAYAALVWVSQHASSLNGDPTHIVTAGDSAGGNLAAAVALISRDRDGPKISAQVLIYPATNLSELTTDSYQKFGNGLYLTKRYIENFRAMYLPHPEDWHNELASPLLAATFKNLPPTLVLTAEFDPLRDEGQSYAEKLKKAGVPTTHIRYGGMIHGFVGMTRLFDQSEHAIDDISAYLQNSLQ